MLRNESDWACISLAEEKPEEEMSQEQVEAWPSITKDGEILGCILLQRICDQVYKWKFDFVIVNFSHYFLSL